MSFFHDAFSAVAVRSRVVIDVLDVFIAGVAAHARTFLVDVAADVLEFVTAHYHLILRKVQARLVATGIGYSFLLGTVAAIVIAVCKDELKYARLLLLLTLAFLTAVVVLGIVDAYSRAPEPANRALALFADLLAAIAKVAKAPHADAA